MVGPPSENFYHPAGRMPFGDRRGFVENHNSNFSSAPPQAPSDVVKKQPQATSFHRPGAYAGHTVPHHNLHHGIPQAQQQHIRQLPPHHPSALHHPHSHHHAPPPPAQQQHLQSNLMNHHSALSRYHHHQFPLQVLPPQQQLHQDPSSLIPPQQHKQEEDSSEPQIESSLTKPQPIPAKENFNQESQEDESVAVAPTPSKPGTASASLMATPKVSASVTQSATSSTSPVPPKTPITLCFETFLSAGTFTCLQGFALEYECPINPYLKMTSNVLP